ncbi:MAG: ferrochelatase [Proteobacteria bacterium]|nr:ferrochelatase [Pseudomonadota bacterium]
MTKTAVVLFNLGGPDNQTAVQPFLFNLFNDKAIIRLPNPMRWMIAKLISSRRAPVAQEIYAHIGGGSPIIPETERQADALTSALSDLGEVKIFIAMRYWHPMSDETANKVTEYDPDNIVLLPLYPQFSTTTTGSSIEEWYKAAKRAGLSAPTRAICCYPDEEGWIKGQARLLREHLAGAKPGLKYRVLFSAHGLPEKIVKAGDPYQSQVEESAAAIAKAAGLGDDAWMICYQSRVGPMTWIGPSLDIALEQAAHDDMSVIIVPIAFVSEHSETLVELDIEYRKIAEILGITDYIRVPTIGIAPEFIEGLARLVRRAQSQTLEIDSGSGGRICGNEYGDCICQAPQTSN